MGRNMMLRPVVSSSTLDIHMRLFSHLLTCFYTSLLHRSMLNPNLLYLTYGFYVCLILLLWPDVQITSFAPFWFCLFLTDHWQVVYSHSVSVASPCLICSLPIPEYLCATSCIAASEWKAAILPSISLQFIVKDANIFFYREQILALTVPIKVSCRTKTNKSKTK